MGKSGLVAEPIVTTRTRHRLAPSRISVPIVRLGRLLIPAYLRFTLYFRKIEIRHPEKIVETLRDFQEKRIRLIVAFRHAYGDEALLLFHVFDNLLPRWAKHNGTPLKKIPHVRVVHDFAVPLWSDAFVRFILPRSGAVPVYHIKFDPASLKNIRSILLDDPCPLGLAPEGQISYHSETLPRIEQGTIRMGFWCAKDLVKDDRHEQVIVLPLSIHYQYDLRDKKKVLAAIDSLEILCGCIPASARGRSGNYVSVSTLSSMQSRMEAIEARILEIVEAYYSTTYGYQPPTSMQSTDGWNTRQSRWEALQEVALEAAEHSLGLVPNKDDLVHRMYRIRQEGWDRIYPEVPVDGRTPLESALENRRTGEAWFAMRHMEFVDLMSYQDDQYLSRDPVAGPSYDRIVETVVNLQDLVSRLMGGNIKNRPNVIRKKAVLVPGPGLNLTDRLPEYQKNAKQAARNATAELDKRFKDCIKEYLHGSKD